MAKKNKQAKKKSKNKIKEKTIKLEKRGANEYGVRLIAYVTKDGIEHAIPVPTDKPEWIDIAAWAENKVTGELRGLLPSKIGHSLAGKGITLREHLEGMTITKLVELGCLAETFRALEEAGLYTGMVVEK